MLSLGDTLVSFHGLLVGGPPAQENIVPLELSDGLITSFTRSWVGGLGNGKGAAIGWFQMFHSSAFKSLLGGEYPEESADTWWDDIKLVEAFGDNQECLNTMRATTVNTSTSNARQVENWYLNVKKTKID